ncbi:MAG: asparagine synthase (glutamine-hydrolyzing) [Pseudomonadota bacterium]
MCGIAGFVAPGARLEDPTACLGRMIDSLAHRGPDDQGVWVDSEITVGLAHRRLSIVDLSQEGHQPMRSVSGRYVISYNGEVYNHDHLRGELKDKGFTFRGHSDTETILAAVEEWGLEAALKRFIGMFAFALWDRAEQRLILVRDRIGIKPLYYGSLNGVFVFGSELKAFLKFPGFSGAIDRNAIALHLHYNYIPAPYTIYQDLHKLRPGHVLSLDVTPSGDLSQKLQSYWSATEVANNGLRHPFTGSADDAIERLDALLRDAVKLRMLADVPLGAFLSGGIDSSIVVAMMQAQSARPVKTFTIGFNENSYNEAEHAKAVASYLGTDHTELYVSAQDALDVIPSLPTHYDEPFSDPSQIPTFLVSKLARKHVTVSLSGDGGDELFYGYDRYLFTQRIWNTINWMPRRARMSLGNALLATMPASWRTPTALAEVLTVKQPESLYRRVRSHWKNPAAVVLGADEWMDGSSLLMQQVAIRELHQWMMLHDLINYLPDDILVKLDRTSMAVGLEARVPILDHRIVEFAWTLPHEYKWRDSQGKWILRQVLYKYVPKEIIDRPKMGFGVPIDSWLRGPLREWCEDLLDEQRLRSEGYFEPKAIREKWHEHLSGKHNWHHYLWDVLMFQSWYRSCNDHRVSMGIEPIRASGMPKAPSSIEATHAVVSDD